MSAIIDRRVCAELDGEFVLFIIGMRINKPWKVWKWLPVAQAMPRMLIELAKQPGLGLLHVRTHFGFPGIMGIQYWRSFEHLEAYAKSDDATHLPAWRAFNKAVGSGGDVGIWHETYRIAPGQYEAIYNNMPAYGLGRAGTLVDAVQHRKEARERMRANAAA
jgi:Domain of unknown function (DUF4188)